jgi:hypothetical protein
MTVRRKFNYSKLKQFLLAAFSQLAQNKNSVRKESLIYN